MNISSLADLLGGGCAGRPLRRYFGSHEHSQATSPVAQHAPGKVGKRVAPTGRQAREQKGDARLLFLTLFSRDVETLSAGRSVRWSVRGSACLLYYQFAFQPAAIAISAGCVAFLISIPVFFWPFHASFLPSQCA